MTHLEDRPCLRFYLPPYGHFGFSLLRSAHEYAFEEVEGNTSTHTYVHVRC